MNLYARRRALMSVGSKPLNFVSIVPSVLNWKANGSNTTLISNDSFSLQPATKNSWSYYVYSTRTMPFKYSELVGKTIVIDFDATNVEQLTVGLGVASSNAMSGGISSYGTRSSFSNQSTTTGHYHREIVIGTDFTVQDSYKNYYVSFYVFGHNANTANIKSTVTNFTCGYYE